MFQVAKSNDCNSTWPAAVRRITWHPKEAEAAAVEGNLVTLAERESSPTMPLARVPYRHRRRTRCHRRRRRRRTCPDSCLVCQGGPGLLRVDHVDGGGGGEERAESNLSLSLSLFSKTLFHSPTDATNVAFAAVAEGGSGSFWFAPARCPPPPARWRIARTEGRGKSRKVEVPGWETNLMVCHGMQQAKNLLVRSSKSAESIPALLRYHQKNESKKMWNK
jgi:hypothetical protein